MTFAGEGRTWWARVRGPGLEGALVVVAAALLSACGDDDAAGVGSSLGSATQTTTTDTTTDTTATTSATDSASTTHEDPTTTTTGPEPTTDAPPPALMVACGTPPMGAQGADYEHQPSASGGKPGYMWSAVGLPEGLMIHPNSGEISGVPTTPGAYTIELTVTDVADTTAMTSCQVTIGDALMVDYEALAADGPCVVEGGKTILDYISGGDGSPITCSTPAGVGNGKIPMGLKVDPDTCEITGSLAETRYGGWGWIVAAEQSGVKVYAPYCAVQSQQAPMAYSIVGDHSGKMNNTLEPMVVDIDANAPLRFDGEADPAFAVTTPSCGNSCFFGFLYRVTMSPFGTGACKDDKDGCFGLCPLVPDPNEPDGDKAIQCSLLPVMGSPKIGFAHEMWAKGDVLPDEFKSRPFIIQWSMDYCLSEVGAECQGKDAILANGDNSNLEFPVIFRPQ